MTQQELRNRLTSIEDDVRYARDSVGDYDDRILLRQALDSLTQLTQLIREEIVK